jgi:steroid 5-alpha reductase family enzyme
MDWLGVLGTSTGWHVALMGLAAAAVLAFATWGASVVRTDVSLVDRTWSLMIVVPAFVYAALLMPTGPAAQRMPWVLALMAAWALRLAFYISKRNWGHGEDRRYQEIRARNQPNFTFKSLYLVFVLQAVLAWLVSAPALAAFSGTLAFGALDFLGLVIGFVGLAMEATSDAQMARFKADPANKGQVMDRGLWRYSRHPNYFGECCVWWGLGLVALASGGGVWAVLSPLIMTVLLLKVSGVTLLEKDIGERRPKYREYIARTNAFFPGPRKSP